MRKRMERQEELEEELTENQAELAEERARGAVQACATKVRNSSGPGDVCPSVTQPLPTVRRDDLRLHRART